LTQNIVADARIELTVGGSLVARVDVPLVLDLGSGECGDSPCDPTCGSSVIDGANADLVCDSVTCECSTPLIETRLTTGLVLEPGTIIEVTVSPVPGNEPIPRVSGLLEWGSWQRRVVASRINPAPNQPDAFEIFLDWVIDFKGLNSDQGDQWLPIDLAASAHGTHLGDECPDPKNYVTCLDCCLDECVCFDPDVGDPDCLIWDLMNGDTACSIDADCPEGTLNGLTVQLQCVENTGLCRSPVFTTMMEAPLVAVQPFIAYLLAADGALPELDYSQVRADIELPAIPTVSVWGVVAMTLLLLTGGTVVILRRRQVAA